MASNSTREDEELCCPVCHEIFKHPVILSCSHSFCKGCLQEWWTRKPVCPVCRICSKEEPITNLVLKNLCERHQSALSERSDVFCVPHGQKLTLFCLEDKVPTCLVCRDSKKHNHHRFRPIDEATLDLKVELQKLLNPLQEKMKVLDKVEADSYKRENHIQVQAQHIEKQIKEQFKKLHHFLQKEEDLKLCAMREEEAQKSQVMRGEIEWLSRNKAKLSATIGAAEDQLKVNNDISFLQNYKATVENVQLAVKLPDPQPVSEALMDVAKHLGNLTFRVWDRMKEIVSYTPVILDPNTAHDRLNLSEDLTCVKLGFRQQLPDNPERCYNYVQGSEGFNSGSRSWDVEVGHHTHWELGVSEQRYPRMLNGRFWNFWLIEFYHGKYNARSSSAGSINLSVNQKARRIRVQLDPGMVSFSDLDSNAQLHTFRHHFHDKLFPIFGTYMSLPLKVLPRKVCVTQEHT